MNYNKEDQIESFLSELEQKSGISAGKLVFAFCYKGYCDKLFQPQSIEEFSVQEDYKLHAFEISTTIKEVENLGKKVTLKSPKPEN